MLLQRICLDAVLAAALLFVCVVVAVCFAAAAIDSNGDGCV